MSKVSIILPSYNKKKYIPETISSVLQQTHQNIELIIIDDNSTDGTRGYLHELQKKEGCNPKIKVIINNENLGANHRRNQGLGLATGEYVIFLDADDILAQTCVEQRVSVMRKSSDIDFAVFAMGIFVKKPGDNKISWASHSKKPLVDFLRHELPWQTMQPIWKKDVVLKTGGFDEAFQRLQDVEFHTRVLFDENVKFKLFPTIIDCYYRIDEDRKNYDMYNFLLMRTKSSIQYYNKYNNLSQQHGLGKKICGTIFQTYINLFHYRRVNKIDHKQFLYLEELLLSGSGQSAKVLFKVLRVVNLSFLHKIKGVNFLLFKLITD